ncbi:hypothetical protein ABBQ38_010977 [Trebouxia sp. C0009 RCD-2024]
MWTSAAMWTAGQRFITQHLGAMTALHWAAYAPIKPLEHFLKEQAISEGASEQSLVLNHGIVQVLYELLKNDPDGAKLCYDKGPLNLPLTGPMIIPRQSWMWSCRC